MPPGCASRARTSARSPTSSWRGPRRSTGADGPRTRCASGSANAPPGCARRAARHETAAASLESHGVQVDGLKDTIVDLERRSRALVADGTLEDFDAPVAGHKDWLGVTLPRHPMEG